MTSFIQLGTRALSSDFEVVLSYNIALSVFKILQELENRRFAAEAPSSGQVRDVSRPSLKLITNPLQRILRALMSFTRVAHDCACNAYRACPTL